MNTPPLDLKFVAFCSEFSGCSYLEFLEKIISGEFFRNFHANPSIKTCEILPYFLRFLFCVRNALKKFTHVLSYVVCNLVRRHVHKRITKRRYGEEKLGGFVFGKSILFTLVLWLTKPYFFVVLVWNFYQTFVTVSILFWLRVESQIRPTRLAINFVLITTRAERKVCLCVKLFDFFRGWILICLTWKLSRFVPNSVEILTWSFWKKTISREFFRNFHANQGYPLPKFVKFRPTFCGFYSASVLHWKKVTKVLSYVVCTQVRRYVHKRIT